MRQGGAPDILQGGMRAPSGPKPVGDMPKLCLEDWLQENLDRALNHAILHRRNAQRPELPWFTGFGDELAPRWAGPICAGAQFEAQLIEEAVLTAFLPDALRGYPIDPGGPRAFVRSDVPPGMAKHAGIDKPPPHIPPSLVGMCPTPLIEFALNAEYPSIGLGIRVHRSFLRLALLSSSCFPSPCARLSRAPTTTEAPPSVPSISCRCG